MNRLIPMLPVKSMAASVEFYGKLGFSVEERNDGWGWAMLRFGECRVMVDQSINVRPDAPRQGVLYLYPDDVAEYHRQVRANGVTLPELNVTFYDMTECRIDDPDGNRLWIGQARMKKMTPAANPDAYVEALSGWRNELVKSLRAAVRGAGALEEAVKWGHLVYASGGPVLLIRAEEERVLFGFWRGKRLLEIEPRLKASGKYEMATLELREGMTLKPTLARRLTREAIALNKKLGDPTRDAKRPAKKKR